MTSNHPTIEAQQAVIDAAERGVQIAGGDQRYVRLTKVTLKAAGLELARNLQPGENASLCIPAEVARDGRYYSAMVLLSDKRTVITWAEGTFRVKVRSIAFAHADISEVATATRGRGDLSLFRDAITFVADGARYEFVLPSKVAGGRLTFMVSGVLSGGVTFDQDSDPG